MRYRRTYLSGATYFFTVNLLDRKSILLTTHISKLRQAFKKIKDEQSFSIDAIVILPDHLHTLITFPDSHANFSVLWNQLKGAFSRSIPCKEMITCSRKNKRERGIWQRRFWEHLIKDELDFEHHYNCIHYNPVKHGYVESPRQWKYSSIHKAIHSDILDEHWASHPLTNHTCYSE